MNPLEAIKDEPHKRKVWLRWNDDDAARVITSSLFSPRGTGAKYLDLPLGRYARVQFDQVRAQDELVGISAQCGYTVNVGGCFSIGMLDSAAAVDGKEVTVVWGEENGGTAKLGVERHVQTEIRATVHTTAPLG